MANWNFIWNNSICWCHFALLTALLLSIISFVFTPITGDEMEAIWTFDMIILATQCSIRCMSNSLRLKLMICKHGLKFQIWLQLPSITFVFWWFGLQQFKCFTLGFSTHNTRTHTQSVKKTQDACGLTANKCSHSITIRCV